MLRHHIVGIPRHLGPIARQFSFQTDRIINYDFATQHNKIDLLTQSPDPNRIWIRL